jgi:hypothetical protein
VPALPAGSAGADNSASCETAQRHVDRENDFVGPAHGCRLRAVVDPRMACDQRPGRLRLRHHIGHPHASSSRASDGPGRRPVHHRAGRADRTRRPRACPGGRAAHGHRRLPLVHRLGPRHDDQRWKDSPSTGRYREAGYRSCAPSPTTFATGSSRTCSPNGSSEGLYNTADATLWFFHAVDRYLETTGDRATLQQLLPTLRSIADCIMRGTRFGIRVDPEDGLLRRARRATS